MVRVLIGLSLNLFVASAFASPPSVTPDDTGTVTCPKAAKPSAAPTADADSATDKAADPAASAPHHIRGGGNHPATPRWHSMLPGMFR